MDKFARQLETFADLRGVAGQVPVFTPTPDTVLSYRTVSALLPYEAEFQRAGLAVTAAQQSGLTPERKKAPLRPLGALNLTPPKEKSRAIGIGRRPQLAANPGTATGDNLGEITFDGVHYDSRPTGKPLPAADQQQESSGGTETIFAGADSPWDFSHLDRAPPHAAKPKPRPRLECCNCSSPQSSDAASRSRPTVARVSLDNPAKMLARWQPVHPQSGMCLLLCAYFMGFPLDHI